MPAYVKGTNLRSMVITTESGKDFRDTQVVSGSAQSTPAEKARNTPTQYQTGGGNRKAPLGGKHSNS